MLLSKFGIFEKAQVLEPLKHSFKFQLCYLLFTIDNTENILQLFDFHICALVIIMPTSEGLYFLIWLQHVKLYA